MNCTSSIRIVASILVLSFAFVGDAAFGRGGGGGGHAGGFGGGGGGFGGGGFGGAGAGGFDRGGFGGPGGPAGGFGGAGGFGAAGAGDRGGFGGPGFGAGSIGAGAGFDRGALGGDGFDRGGLGGDAYGAFDRSPSLSRSLDGAAVNRPALPAAGQFGNSFGDRGAAAYDRPSQGDLNRFLNMPGSSSFGATQTAGDRQSYTTQGGTTITHGDNGTVIRGDDGAAAFGHGSVTTPGGTTIGGAGAVGYREGPNGGVHAAGAGVAGATNGSDAHVAGGGFNAVRGPNGAAAGTAAGFRGTVNDGKFTGNAAAASGVRGPYGNTWTNRSNAKIVNGQIVAGQHWNTVNGNFTHWNYFGPRWFGYYPNAWWPGQWAAAATAWTTASWALAGAYCGCTGDPYYYDYGSDVTYQNNTVYYGSQPIAAADQYYQQAIALAMRGQSDPTNNDWLPLGVFAVTTTDQTKAEKMLQLAVNRDGIIRGNFTDAFTNQVTPVFGAVDKTSQRLAIMTQGNNSLVAETGLYNLTNDEASMLVHFDATRQEQRTLVRLHPPANADAQQQQGGPPQSDAPAGGESF